jgi:predicted metalloprotease with PDZ domain
MKKAPGTWFALVLFGWTCVYSTALFCQSPAPSEVRYTVSLAGYQEHRVHVEMELPTGQPQRRVQLPVWNALYQVRDFAQYITRVRVKGRAEDASGVRSIDKTTWEIDGAQNGAIVEYEILAVLSGPYGAQLNASHAFFNLAEILMYLPDTRSARLRLRFTDVPSGWKVATSLPSEGDVFRAENYDQMVDSPVEIGTFAESDFDEGGGHYRVVVDADPSDYDMQKIVANLHRIVAAATGWMEDRPFQTYVFLYHFPRGPGGGGMEHAYCTAIDVNAQSVRENPAALNGVTAHEFFHLWNVKRIRPQSLEPIDYSKENYTRALWFSEGVTTTVENIFLVRAGLLDEAAFLKKLSEEITELEQRPARLTQSAEDSSLDAWLEKYPYYREAERSISYYNKGNLLGVLLDLAVRDASQGKVSLRNVFQWMNEHYARQGKFFPDSAGVRTAAESVSHSDLSSFFANYVAGIVKIPWDHFFQTAGLQVVRRRSTIADAGFVAAHNFDAPPSVVRVRSGSEAERAGLIAGDELLAFNGRATAADFERRMGELRPGETIRLHVRRHGLERDLQWKIGSREEVEFEVKDVDNVTTQQKARRAAWLRGEAQLTGD